MSSRATESASRTDVADAPERRPAGPSPAGPGRVRKGSPSGWEKRPEVIECGVLKSKKADAGQSADDKLLRGWLDIDEHFGGGSAPADLSGVNNRVFVGNAQAAAKP